MVCRKLMHEVLSVRKSTVGLLLHSLRKISGIKLDNDDDLEIQLHSSASEPYYYETAYKFSVPEEVTIVDRVNKCLMTQLKSPKANECPLYTTVIPVDETGRCVLAEEIGISKTSDDRPKSWRCSEFCKQLTNEEINEILQIKLVFERPLEEVRAFLQDLDCGCQHDHCKKKILIDGLADDDGDTTRVEVQNMLGHPLQCASGDCNSRLRLLRQAAVHHPVICNLLVKIYSAKRSSDLVHLIDRVVILTV